MHAFNVHIFLSSIILLLWGMIRSEFQDTPHLSYHRQSAAKTKEPASGILPDRLFRILIILMLNKCDADIGIDHHFMFFLRPCV